MTSFDELYARYHDHIYRFTYALTGDAHEAEDLFQETWLRVFRGFPAASAEGGGKDPRAWLFTVAANAHRDALRKKRVRRLFLLDRTRSLAGSGSDADPGWDTPGLSRDGGLEAGLDIKLCLRKAVSVLPAREKRVFILKDIEGFSHLEIAVMLGIPEGTVRTLLHKAVIKLRKELAGFGPGTAGDKIIEEEGS